MKRAVCVMLCIVLVLSACLLTAGCRKTVQEEGVIGDSKVLVKDHVVTKDTAGKDVVVFTFMYTNNFEESGSFYGSVMVEAFQGDLGLFEYLDGELEGYDEDAMMRNIKTGATIEVQLAFELVDTTTEIQLEIAEVFSLFEEEKIVKTFPL